MTQALEALAEQISARFGGKLARIASRCDELTFEVAPEAPCIKCNGPAVVTAWFAKAY